MIGVDGYGILLYLTGHEGRGIGLVDKIRAYAQQEQGLDTVEANKRLGLPVDARDYSGAVRALRSLGVDGVRLATNNPDKVRALTEAGIGVRRVSLNGFVSSHNRAYLRTKDELMGHLDSQGILSSGTTR
jgi:GTP cyclohydrolase II